MRRMVYTQIVYLVTKTRKTNNKSTERTERTERNREEQNTTTVRTLTEHYTKKKNTYPHKITHLPSHAITTVAQFGLQL